MQEEDQKHIRMKIDIDSLREIYFSDKHHQVFFGPSTFKQSILLSIGIIVSPFYFGYALSLGDGILVFFGIIALSLLFFEFWKVARPIVEWKKLVRLYLERAEKVRSLTVYYTDTYILHIQDNEELKKNWDIIDKAVITDKYIWLYSDNNILLPKAAMRDSEFDALVGTILKKVKNVEKN